MNPSELSAAAIAAYDGVGGASLAGEPGGLVSGTPVETPAGPVAVERLRPGDIVLTRAGAEARITRMSRRAISAETLARAPALRPVRLRPSSLGHLLPTRVLWLAPGQMIFVRDIAASAAALVNGTSVRRGTGTAGVVYFGPRLDPPAAIVAEGLGCATVPLRADADAVLPLRAALAALAGVVQGELHGNIARLDHTGAEGWVVDRGHPDLPVAVEMVIDGAVVGRALADRRRPDLEMAGLGSCAFALRLRHRLSAARNYVVQLRRLDDGADVPGSPLLLPAAEGDPASLDAGLRAQMQAAGDDAARSGLLAGFLAAQVDLLAQNRVERPAMPPVPPDETV